jgi:hypothetical protein
MERRRENYHVECCESPKSGDIQNQPKRSQKRYWSYCEVKYGSEEDGRGPQEKIGGVGKGEQASARGGEKGQISTGPRSTRGNQESQNHINNHPQSQEQVGLSQADFGKLAGVTTGAVYLWENKEGPLNLRDKTKAALLSIKGMGASAAKGRLANAEERK